jgi:hypothetical protein
MCNQIVIKTLRRFMLIDVLAGAAVTEIVVLCSSGAVQFCLSSEYLLGRKNTMRERVGWDSRMRERG